MSPKIAPNMAVSSLTYDAASGNRLRFVLSTLRRWTRSRVLPASGRLSRCCLLYTSTREILELMRNSKTLEEAVEKVKALLNK